MDNNPNISSAAGQYSQFLLVDEQNSVDPGRHPTMSALLSFKNILADEIDNREE